MLISNYRKTVDKLQGRKEYLFSKIEQRKKTQTEIEHRLEIILKVQDFIQVLAVETQSQVKFRIEKIIQMALDICFPGQYEFVLEFKINTDKTECKLTFFKDDQEESPEDDSGGGLRDILAFVFRVALWSLGDTRAVLFLDEPFSALSKDIQEKAGKILRQVSKELKVQIIMSTQNQDMQQYADKVFLIKAKKKGNYTESVVKVIK